jgi:hypothetical protein
MKKLFIAIVAVAFSTAVFAQSAPKAGAKSTTVSVDHYTMKDGVMMHSRGAKEEAMTGDLKLNNGTVVSSKGEITMPDGKKSMLKNGQSIDMQGKITNSEKMSPDMKKSNK